MSRAHAILLVVLPVLIIVASIKISTGAARIFGNTKISGNTTIDNAAESFAFALVADVHIGRPGTFDADEPSNYFVHMITNFNPQFIVVAGDICDQSAYTQAIYYSNLTFTLSNASHPIWTVAGNHDACPNCGDDAPGCDAGIAQCPTTYSNYIFTLNGGSSDMHWVRDYGNTLRFIGFDSRQIRTGALTGFGYVEDAEYTWLTNAIEESRTAAKKSILLSHYPLVDTWGNNIKVHQTEIINAMSNAGNVVAYFGGHRHQWGDHITNAGTIHVNCPGLAYSGSAFDSPYSAHGGFFIATVSNRWINLRLFAADNPTYTMRLTNFSIQY